MVKSRRSARLTNNLHSELRSIVRTCRDVLDLAEREHAVNDSAEDDMLAVQEVALRGGDKELAPIGVRAGVSLGGEET